jgi:hypothetical protein
MPLSPYNRHAGAGGVVKPALQFFYRDAGAWKSHPARGLHKLDAGLGVVKGEFSRRR